MNRETTKTTSLKKEEITRKWYIVDATDKPLGRLASEIAVYLMGKEKNKLFFCIKKKSKSEIIL